MLNRYPHLESRMRRVGFGCGGINVVDLVNVVVGLPFDDIAASDKFPVVMTVRSGCNGLVGVVGLLADHVIFSSGLRPVGLGKSTGSGKVGGWMSAVLGAPKRCDSN